MKRNAAHDLLAARRAVTLGGSPPFAPARASQNDGANGTNGANGPQPPVKRLGLVRASSIRMEAVNWTWDGWLPEGKLAIVDGLMGRGKTTMLCNVTAAITTGGPLPGQPHTPIGDVIVCSLEDGIADTIVPRLRASGANLDRCHVLDGYDVDGERVAGILNLEHDVQRIGLAIEQTAARLVWIDPFMAAIGRKVDSYKDQDMRALLAPLAKIAEETGATIVFARHPRKAGGSAENSGGGSGGIGNSCRSVLRVDDDPESPGPRFLLSCVKSSLAAKPATLRYRIEGVELEQDDEIISTSRIVWDGESTWTAEALAAQSAGGEETARSDEAKDWLRHALAQGPRSAKELFRAAEADGIARRTLQRAADILKVQKDRRGFGEGSHWSLHSRQDDHSRQSVPRIDVAPMDGEEVV